MHINNQSCYHHKSLKENHFIATETISQLISAEDQHNF